MSESELQNPIGGLERKSIRNIVPYDPKQVEYLIKLDANENPFGLPDKVSKRLAKFIHKPDLFRLYPDSNSTALRGKIAAFWNTDPGCVIVGKGSDEVIQMLTAAFIEPGDTVIVPSPSFEMYSVASELAGARVVKVKLAKEHDFEYDANAIIDEAEATRAKIIYLCTPNNPTGNTMPAEAVEYIATMCPRSIVAVDEAYIEFGGTTSIDLTRKYENVIVLRTFSKAWGLAGLRCGYGIAAEPLTSLLYKVKPPYNVPTFSQLASAELLDAADEIAERTAAISAERDRLAEELARTVPGIKVYPSQANFLLVEFIGPNAPTGAWIYAALAEKGILVRSFRNAPDLEKCIRITVGTREQDAKFAGELRMICENRLTGGQKET
jgi:histidinol-phosphate aminotransferase